MHKSGRSALTRQTPNKVTTPSWILDSQANQFQLSQYLHMHLWKKICERIY